MRSNYAVWSGYQLDNLSFKDFMSTLLGTPMIPDQDVLDLVEAYTSWKRRLPPKQRSKAPNIRCMQASLPYRLVIYLYLRARFRPRRGAYHPYLLPSALDALQEPTTTQRSRPP